MSFNLERCPFCGEAAQFKDIPTPHRHGWVGCPSCGIYKQWTFSPADAVRKWNRRAEL